MLDSHLKSFSLCYFEISEAFRDLKDEHVWVRPGNGLLSIGEIAGHMAYCEAVRFAGTNPDGSSDRDLSNCKAKSPLLDPQFEYYTSTIASEPSETHRTLGASDVLTELNQIHQVAMDSLTALNPAMNSVPPYWGATSNYDELLRYITFHMAYHTGQIYSVRHLLGESTPDN